MGRAGVWPDSVQVLGGTLSSRLPTSVIGELARKRLADRIENGTAEIAVADAARLPWPDSSFTAVKCMDAFPYFPDPQAVLGEFFRVPRPGGRAVVSFAAHRLPEGVESRQARGVAGTYTAISEATARRMVELKGFDPVIVTWASIAGERRVVKSVLRLLGGDEMDIVIGHKPSGAVDVPPD
ncbi:MAG: methyltransferase domain-containing protein [Candidatus Nanopelagicales bacterium]